MPEGLPGALRGWRGHAGGRGVGPPPGAVQGGGGAAERGDGGAGDVPGRFQGDGEGGGASPAGKREL